MLSIQFHEEFSNTNEMIYGLQEAIRRLENSPLLRQSISPDFEITGEEEEDEEEHA